MNPGEYPLTISPGEVIGRYLASGEIQELDHNVNRLTQVHTVGGCSKTIDINSEKDIPEHLILLYE